MGRPAGPAGSPGPGAQRGHLLLPDRWGRPHPPWRHTPWRPEEAFPAWGLWFPSRCFFASLCWLLSQEHTRRHRDDRRWGHEFFSLAKRSVSEFQMEVLGSGRVSEGRSPLPRLCPSCGGRLLAAPSCLSGSSHRCPWCPGPKDRASPSDGPEGLVRRVVTVALPQGLVDLSDLPRWCGSAP